MQEKKRAARNRTLTVSADEASILSKRCLKEPRQNLALNEAIDQIILDDTFNALDYLPHNSVDLLVVDPPYNLSKDYHGNKFDARKSCDYEAFTRDWLEKCIPLLKPSASIYVCCDWKSSLIIGTLLNDYFIIQNRITWQREKGRGAKSNWKNGLEDIWFATVSKTDYTFNLEAVKQRRKVIAPYKQDGKPKDWKETAGGKFRDTCPSNFWDDCTIPYWSMPENTDHPTQKPEKLVAKMVLASSNPGDLILDPFLGSGTTAVVAKKLSRNFIGIEQNELYCAWAMKRLDKASQDITIQGYSDGVFWERNSLPSQKAISKATDIAQQSLVFAN